MTLRELVSDIGEEHMDKELTFRVESGDNGTFDGKYEGAIIAGNSVLATIEVIEQ